MFIIKRIIKQIMLCTPFILHIHICYGHRPVDLIYIKDDSAAFYEIDGLFNKWFRDNSIFIF